MKDLLDTFNRAFENKARLGIMSVLLVNDAADFTRLKELLGLTDGNLSSHTRALEDLGYVQATKQFVGRKPNTRFTATPAGRQAFAAHLNALEALLKNNTPNP